MIITIDGPAGAGKSTAARNLATRLGFAFLDTGAMYRAVAWTCLNRGVDFDDEAAVAGLARALEIRFEGEDVLVDGRNVSAEIRTNEITAASRHVAANVEVRKILVELQRQAAGDGDVVSEGRDQGTVAFPQGEFKFYITASPESRARRRQQEFAERGESVPLAQILAEQEDRDQRDATRAVGPLKPADDAMIIDTSAMGAEEVVEFMVRVVQGS